MAKKILVVDDDTLVLASLKKLFTKEGYGVETALNGQKALQMVEKEDFDIVIIDIRMPGLDGIETTKRIKEVRKNQSKPEIAVVFITGYSDIEPIEEAKKYGEVIKKPFNLEVFLEHIRQHTGKRRVVITGLGVVAPNGIGKEEFWEKNIEGISGIEVFKDFSTSELPSKIAGQIKKFNPSQYMPLSVVNKTDRFTQLGIAGAKLALEDSKLDLEAINKERIGVSIGSGLGGILFHEEQISTMYEKGFKKAEPLGIPKVAPNAVPGYVSIIFGFTGPNVAISTACSSGAHGIGWAYDMIKQARADVMVAGGSEAPLTPYTFAAFNALRTLSKRNDSPKEASRPFDNQRDGFVLSEGSGILILEELTHALKRRAHIYAEIIGYSVKSGAYHMVMPVKEGKDAARTMEEAIREAGIKPHEINYINAHGTSTKANDRAETRAIKEVFGKYAYDIPVSSIKSMIGHTIGASGAIEAVICSLIIENSIIPPTINYQHPDPDCDLDYTPNHARKQKVDIALSNSFGFGSNNACLVLRKYNG
jgi:3-oxoacyl-[acyl-carrier-protein] synthase II